MPLIARLLLAVLCTAALAGGAASSSGAERSWVIQGDTVIGGYLVQKDGTLFGALRQFGPPTSKRHDPSMMGWNGCLVVWKNLGLRIAFYNLGGQDSCQPQYGYFRDGLITGKKWRTASGLRIGDPMRWIFRYHPKAKPTGTGAWWSLLERFPVWGDGAGYTALAVKVNRGSVAAFSVWYQAGGD
jgi:hypothetical protein